MKLRYEGILRIISIIVLIFFSWTFGGMFDVAYAVKDSVQKSAVSGQQKQKEQRPEEKLQKSIEDIEGILSDTVTDTDSKKNKLKNKKEEIESLDVEIRKQFAGTEDKIKDLPEVIKQRHRDFVKKYEDNLKEFKADLDDIDNAKTTQEKETSFKKAKEFLEKVKPPKKHQLLDPNKLPHRTPEVEKIEPRTTPEEFKTEGRAQNTDYRQKPILLASNGSLDGLLTPDSELLILNSPTPDPQSVTPVLLAQATNLPTSADLSQTIEVQFTPEITAKAQELQNDPVKIYNWVRNNIEFVPTYGSIQGANMCLQTKLCNAFDTSSLLISLLRASNIPAKYVYGTVEIPIEKVMNWVGGFTNKMEALSLLASAGIPTKGMLVGGEVKYVRIEHIWVEAWIDYIPSRGARHSQGDTWISLDASFKQYDYTQGIDIKSAVPFDAQSFINQIQATATINETEGYVTGVNSSYINQTMTDYQTQVQNYITQNYPNATVGDVLGKKEIVKQEFSYLLGTLPYRTIVKGAKYAELPDSLRHRLTFEVYRNNYDELLGTKLTVTRTLPELAGKRISLNYVPATDADKNLIVMYVQDSATLVPAYLVHLKAELKVDNTIIATGPSITMGTDQVLTLTFSSIKISEKETHLMLAGDFNVVGLNIGGAKAIFEKRIAQNDFSDPVSEMLHQTILGYWAEYDTLSDIYTKVYNVASVRLPSEGLSSVPVNIEYTFGVPYSGYYAGKGLDVKRDIAAILSLSGDKEKARGFNQSAGLIGSLLEGVIFDQLFGYEIENGLSTVKILDLANAQGIPIYSINSTNVNTILPNLQISGDVKNDIKNAINAGKEVVVPKSTITHNGWTGVGYIIRDPNTWGGGYIIEGGTAGGVYKYEARTAAVTIDNPFSLGVMTTISAWQTSVGEVALAEIAGTVGIDIAALIAASETLLALLIIAMLIVIIGSVIDTITKTRVPPKYELFRHYSDKAGVTWIIATAFIKITYGGDLGDGSYVTDYRNVEPDSFDNRVAICQVINKQPISECPYFIKAYVELLIDTVRRPLIRGAIGVPHLERQFMYPAISGPLRIDGGAVKLQGFSYYD